MTDEKDVQWEHIKSGINSTKGAEIRLKEERCKQILDGWYLSGALEVSQAGDGRKTGQLEVSGLQEDLGVGLSATGCIFQAHVTIVKHLMQAAFENKGGLFCLH